MGWASWILASAVALAFYDLAKKASVRGNAVLPVLLISTFCGSVAFVSAMLLRGGIVHLLDPGREVMALALVKSLIVSTSWVLTFCALRTLPVTIATPIRASAPALVFVMALFLYGEVPTWIQSLGMVFVFAGYWAFSVAGRHEGIDFFRNRAVWYAIAGACCSAVSSIWDKYCLQIRAVPVEALQLWFQLGLFLVYGVMFAARFFFRLGRDRFEWRWTIPCVGVLLALADWLYFTGLAIPDVPISVGSLMRRFSVVITFVLGAVVFRERNLARKAVALVAVIVGIVLLAI